MKKDKDTINIYWSPIQEDFDNDWSMLARDPINLFESLKTRKLPNNKNNPNYKTDNGLTFFQCPSFKSKTQNIYFINNALETEYLYDCTNIDSPKLQLISKTGVNAEIIRVPSISDGPTLRFKLLNIFFSDEPIEATFYQPIFHKSEYSKNGSVIPGTFDIGQWFRPYNFEVQLWEKSGTFKIKEDEPLFYVEFNTNKKINLQRFVMNDKLYKYLKSCTGHSIQLWPFISLAERYDHFKKSQLNNLILKEIKENLLKENV